MCQRLKQRGCARKGIASAGVWSAPTLTAQLFGGRDRLAKFYCPKKLLSCSFCFFGGLLVCNRFLFWILQFGEINVSSRPFNSRAESELDYNPSAPFFIVAACREHWKVLRQKRKRGWNRATYNVRRGQARSFSSAGLQLIKLLLRAVRSTNQQPQMPNASNNARTVLHCLVHTWTDIDGDFAHAQHLVLYLAPINPTVTLETRTVFHAFFHLSVFAER